VRVDFERSVRHLIHYGTADRIERWKVLAAFLPDHDAGTACPASSLVGHVVAT
jgi:hypothetical protein